MVNRVRRAAGFTLIEVLLVIVIILMLAGALAVYVLPQQAGAQVSTTRLLLKQVESALETYRLNIGTYPKEDQGGLDALLKKPNYENESLKNRWQGPYLKPGTKLEDAWSQKLKYELVDKAAAATGDDKEDAAPYKLYSVGPDGQDGNEDDVYAVEKTKDDGKGGK